MAAEWPQLAGSADLTGIGAAANAMFEAAFTTLSSDQGGIYIAIIYIAMIAIERFVYLFVAQHKWDDREALFNMLSSLFVAIAEAVATGAIFFVAYLYVYDQARWFTIPVSVYAVFAMFFANDLCHYLDHRMQHRISLLWALHIPHHSSTDYNVLVANRGTVLQFGLLTSPVYLILPLLGFPLSVFLFVKFFGNIWGTFSHTKLVGRMGVLEGIFSTPSNHRVHHGVNPQYIDKNFGQVLIIWDRLLGTYQPEEEHPQFGLTEQMPHRGVWQIQTYGVFWLWRRLRAARTPLEALSLALRPPEWSLRDKTDRAHAPEHAMRLSPQPRDAGASGEMPLP